MKALVAYNDDSGVMCTALIPDSALTRCRDPFFVPDDRPWKAMVLRGVRIDRLGKGIAARFAANYYNECMTAVHPYATGAPDGMAACWGRDGALVVSDTVPVSDIPDSVRERIDGLIAYFSESATLKTGDLVLIASPEHLDIQMKSYDIAVESLDGFPQMKLKIR